MRRCGHRGSVDGGEAWPGAHHGEVNRELHRVLRRLIEKNLEDLRDREVPEHALVGEVREEGDGGLAHRLVHAPVRALVQHDEPGQQQLGDIGHALVDDGDERGEDGCERRGSRLRLEQRLAEDAAAALQVLAQQLRRNVLQVGGVDLQAGVEGQGAGSPGGVAVEGCGITGPSASTFYHLMRQSSAIVSGAQGSTLGGHGALHGRET